MAYLSLFLSGFIAATLLPAFSELALGSMVNAGYSNWLLWISATAGNSLGACVNWGLGYFLRGQLERTRFAPNKKHLAKAENLFNSHGKWVLLLAWLPVIGDPLTFVAGTARLRFLWFVCLVTLGKGARYALVLWIANQLGPA